MVPPSRPSAAPPPPDPSEVQEVVDLVGAWTTVPDVAERCGVPLSRVRQWVADRELLTLRFGERGVASIPARFVTDEGPRPDLRGTFTLLADGGMSDLEVIRWLFTPDDALSVPGAPMDALEAGFKTEVRRRAQVLAF